MSDAVARLRTLAAQHNQLVVQLAKLGEDLLTQLAVLEGSATAPGVPAWVSAKEQVEREEFRATPTNPGRRAPSMPPPSGAMRCPTCGAPMARRANRAFCLACEFER